MTHFTYQISALFIIPSTPLGMETFPPITGRWSPGCSSNNLNHLARPANENGCIYATDIEDVKQNQERLWQTASDILNARSKLR